MSVFAKKSNRYFKFANVGDTIEGKIVEVGEQRQSYKYNPVKGAAKELDFWPAKEGQVKGDPKMEIPLTWQTNMNEGPDDTGTPDDGKRVVSVPVAFKRGGMLSAMQDAIQLAGGQDIEVGAYAALRFSGYDPDSQNPANPRKLFEARYQKPQGGGAFAKAPETQQAQGLTSQQYEQAGQQFQQGQTVPAGSPVGQNGNTGWNQPVVQSVPNSGAGGFGSGPVGGQAPAADQWGGWDPAQNAMPQAQAVQPQAQVQQEQQVDPGAIMAMIQQNATDADIQSATGASAEAIGMVRAMAMGGQQ